MVIVSIIVVLILIFSFLGGMKEGVVKHFFSLIALLIAIPLTGLSYRLLATLLSFLPGENWENFVGFFATMAVINVILYFVFSMPRKFIQKVWKKGCLFRLLGGILNVFSAAIGMVTFYLVLRAYPIFGWLEEVVTGSSVLNWLVKSLGFVPAMLPEVFQDAATTVAIHLIHFI